LNDEIEKKISIIQKDLEKLQLKKWWSKLKYKINFIFNWRVRLRKKIQTSKRTKNKKNEDQDWHKK
jgi:hypothetical protein